jgi:recombination protein RecT
MQLHPARDIPQAKLAATVMLVRDGDMGLEVLMTRRSMSASFAPGAYVFPGGHMDDVDALAHHNAAFRAGQDQARRTAALAAVRESFEELGVLLATNAAGEWASSADVAQLDRSQDFYAHTQTAGWTLRADTVFTFARWITDRDLPKRFDVPFLVARMPPGQEPVADESEQFEPVWVRPSDALQRFKAGQFFIIFPTIRTLDKLQAFDSVDALLSACQSEHPLFVSCPRAGLLNGKETRHMEHEPPFGELALVCPHGQIVHELGWQSHSPVQLLANVQRLTAPNAGTMTGPGTNSYVVGTPDTGYVVIDPGPHEPDHLQRLYDACAGDIRLIVCTHSHPDHSPGAAPLQQLCANAPVIAGLPSGPHARSDSQFAPQRVLQDGEVITLAGASHTHSLHVVTTPGHTANHLCLWLAEDDVLFSGDHILNGSTTIISPPDGHMGDYLHALDKLHVQCASDDAFILPAHGYAMDRAQSRIAQLKTHRLTREAKVAQAMALMPQGTEDDWVALAYSDTPQSLWPLAKHSMRAHIEHLRESET